MFNEIVFFEVDGEVFAVYFKDDGTPDYKMNWSGAAYPVYENQDGTFLYMDKKNNNPIANIISAGCHFEFSFCWRGVWEGRIYHKEEEFWSEDLSVISDLWDKIEALLKQRIKDANPEYKHFDD